jgi:hypothetical protein
MELEWTSARSILAMAPLIRPRPQQENAASEPSKNRMERRAARLRALVRMGGTLENRGATLHIVGLRIDVASIADMDEAVWRVAARRIIEMLSVDRRGEVADLSRASLG